MKNSRVLLVWIILAICGEMVLGAMTWLTRGAMAAERSRAEAEARADLEECTRLALWRLDATGAMIVAGENRRPPADYQAGSMPASSTADGLVQLHFELRENGKLTSPEANNNRRKLGALRAIFAKNPLPGDEWALLKSAAETSQEVWNAIPKDAVIERANTYSKRTVPDSRANARTSPVYQQDFSSAEKAQRARNVEDSLMNSADAAAWGQAAIELQNGIGPNNSSAGTPQDATGATGTAMVPNPHITPVSELGSMRAIWIGGELFLLRQFISVLDDEKEKGVQGVWINHEVLKGRLLAEIKDLLPMADLHMATGSSGDPLGLVSFPFRLVRNERPGVVSAGLNVPLVIGWTAVLLALLTTSLLVHGIMKLSERRASFVSAVTHELRTPLTTFRLYSEMLESGVVKPEKRQDYLRVLSREANRLAHMVENVLSFSRIERGGARSAFREMGMGELLESVRERLRERLAPAGLELEMEVPLKGRVRVDTAAVEHILFNLIDNAAKYAANSEPPLVRIETSLKSRRVEIRIRDHGPGIPRRERGRIFRAFHKSAREAAESRPGVGLGLSLSRRLAESLGGRLKCVDSPRGACFLLRLPMV